MSCDIGLHGFGRHGPELCLTIPAFPSASAAALLEGGSTGNAPKRKICPLPGSTDAKTCAPNSASRVKLSSRCKQTGRFDHCGAVGNTEEAHVIIDGATSGIPTY
jgi:hypothetical protein